MRSAMCFTHFQLPRCQIHTLSASWWNKVHNLSRKGENTYKFQSLGPKIYGLQRGDDSRRWTNKSFSTNTKGKNIISPIGQQVADVASLTISNLNTSNRVEISECNSVVPIEQKILEETRLLTIFCFDIETTGFSKDSDRIIEFAARDLSGGVNSTFQTLVNPDKYVTNSYVHGISTYMVNTPGVPRMKEFIPILIQYVKSRQKPGGKILFVAHNGKRFDVPFLKSEFNRCGYEIPEDWRFLDTFPLAGVLIKAEGSKLSAKNLQALREHYGITLTGKAHRAMSDVDVLALVLQKMTRDLKLTVPCLLQNHTFTALETTISSNSKKKKTTSS